MPNACMFKTLCMFVWPFATMNICPIAQEFAKIGLKFSKVVKRPNNLQLWLNFAKSGHTGGIG